MNYKIVIAASLMSIALMSAASAQCLDCASFPDRDVLNNEAPTPASKMARPDSAAGASTSSSYEARAEAKGTDKLVATNQAQHRNYRDANASIAEGSVSADNRGIAHDVLIKSLHDSGYNPAADFNAAGNMKTN